MQVQLDAEAAGRALFDETFQGTLPLYPTWEEQPPAFRSLMCSRALKVATAAIVSDETTSGVEASPALHSGADGSPG